MSGRAAKLEAALVRALGWLEDDLRNNLCCVCPVVDGVPDRARIDELCKPAVEEQEKFIAELRATLPGISATWCDWRPIETAPKDGTNILLLTSDFGAVEGWWDKNETNFYKSQKGWASYDPDNQQGDWVSNWRTPGDDDCRLFCGATPHWWQPLTPKPKEPA